MTTSSLRDRREEFKAGAARFGDQRRTEFLEQALSDKRSKIEEMRMLAFSNDRGTSSKIVPATQQHYADISDDDDPDLYDEDEFSASCAPGSYAGQDDEASMADADGEASIADEHDEDHSHPPNHQPQTRRKKHQVSAATVARKDKAKVKFRQFAGMFLQPDWLLPTKDCIPGDLLARKWFACVRPEGDRVLVFSDSGHTQIRRRNGTVLQNWFRDHRFPKGQTVLDGILCSTNSGIVYVMDVLVWADVALHESEFDFRYFWLQSRLTEENWEEEKKIVMSANHFDGGVNYPGSGGGARGGWKNSRRNARRNNRGKKGTNTIGIGNATSAASEMEIDNEAPAGGSAANDAVEQNEAQTQPQQQPRKKTLRLGPAVPAISADMDMTGAAGSVSAATTTAKKSQLSEVDKVKQTDDTLEFFSLQLVPQTEIGSVDELKQLYRSAPDYVPDGVQFTHVEARYTPGLTPCVLTWKDLHCSRYAIDNFGVGAIAGSSVAGSSGVVATTNPDDVEEASILQLTASGGLLTSDGIEIAKVEVREVAVEPDLPVVHEDDEGGTMAEHEPAASLPPAPLVKIVNLRPTFPTRNSYVRVVLKSVNREEQRVEIDIRKLRKARIRTYADSWARIQFQHMLRRRTKEDLFELLLREVAAHSE
eukprot:g936.t1